MRSWRVRRHEWAANQPDPATLGVGQTSSAAAPQLSQAGACGRSCWRAVACPGWHRTRRVAPPGTEGSAAARSQQPAADSSQQQGSSQPAASSSSNHSRHNNHLQYGTDNATHPAAASDAHTSKHPATGSPSSQTSATHNAQCATQRTPLAITARTAALRRTRLRCGSVRSGVHPLRRLSTCAPGSAPTLAAPASGAAFWTRIAPGHTWCGLE